MNLKSPQRKLMAMKGFSKGVGANLILCQRCHLEVKGKLKKDSMFRYKKYRGDIAPPDSLNFTDVHIGEDMFEAVSTFRYLGNVIGESCGCIDATSAHITAA